MNNEPIIRIPILLNPKKFYIFRPTVSELNMNNEEIVIKTGEEEHLILKKHISGISINGGIAIIKIVRMQRGYYFWCSVKNICRQNRN